MQSEIRIETLIVNMLYLYNNEFICNARLVVDVDVELRQHRATQFIDKNFDFLHRISAIPATKQ